MDITLLAAGSFENVGRVIVGVLAVGGAYLAGSFLTWFFLGGIARIIFRKSIQTGVMKVLRIIGGVALALAVASYVFGDGGFGWGPGNEKKGDTGPGVPE